MYLIGLRINLLIEKFNGNHYYYFNYYLLGTMIISFVLSVIIIYVPFINHLFDFAPLDFKMFMLAIGLGISIIPLVELYKLVKKLIYRNK